MFATLKNASHSAGKAGLALMIAAGLALTAGCGGGGSGVNPGPTPTPEQRELQTLRSALATRRQTA